MEKDPFLHHPALRDMITPADQSRFRDFDPAEFDDVMLEMGAPLDWRYDEADREALRLAEMTGRWDKDLWVFAYGSLCWDPAMIFDEVRRAHLPSYCRRMILKDSKGARGTEEQPGLMAALTEGEGCDGLAFRVPASIIDAETRNLWARERIAPAYASAFLSAETAHGDIEVLAFVADTTAEVIDCTISRDDQVRYIATGAGFLGTSLEYVQKLQSGLGAVGITDNYLDALLADAEAMQQ